jgi:hypothetical protein
VVPSERTCDQAVSEGYEYAWVDTCCIDKSSSAELQEAINSMFKWYQQAKICYAYLTDLPSGSNLSKSLPRCRWFTRGWCLQELIAPPEVRFFDEGWTDIGTRTSCTRLISRITRIPLGVLENSQRMYDMPVARRMSWASTRHTTRVEDQAYCLLGLFDVNMPMLYGEGPKAFLRLQEEIMKRSSDLSIFHNSSTIDESPEDEHNRRKLYGKWEFPAAENFTVCPRTPQDGSESETDDLEVEKMLQRKRWPCECPYPLAEVQYMPNLATSYSLQSADQSRLIMITRQTPFSKITEGVSAFP